MSGEIVNTAQAEAWDGHEGDIWTQEADRYDRAGHRLLEPFFELSPIRTNDRVLDVGCGTGAPTRQAARMASDGEVVGVDLSTRMLDLARKRSADEGILNVTFVRGDVQVYRFEPQTYDLAMSSFGAMFFSDPVAAFTNVARALQRGGRLGLLAWRTLAENDWLMALRGALAVGRELPVPPPDAPTPFSLADPDRVRGILGAAGFSDVRLHPVDEAMTLGTDARDAMTFASTMGIVEGLTQDLDDDARATAMANLEATFAAHESADGVLIGAAAWCITATRD